MKRFSTTLNSIIAIVLFCLSTTRTAAQGLDYYIGTGTTTNCNTCFPSPYYDEYCGDRQQFLYLASELTAAGMGPGLITAIKWNIESIASSANISGWTMTIGSTTLSNLSGGFAPGITWPASGAAMPDPWNPGTGVVAYVFPTPFVWNGTDNIVVQTCHGNGTRTAWTTNAVVKYTTTPFVSTYATYQDGVGSLCVNPGAFTTNMSQRPNITFTYGLPCTGTPSGFTVNAPNQVCPKDTFKIKIAGGYLSNLTYQWQYSLNGTTWSNFLGTVNAYTGETYDAITVPTYYRCKITCTNSGQSYITPAKLVNIAPFYYCYCNTSKATNTAGLDIGNVKIISVESKIKKLDSGMAVPLLGNANAKLIYTNNQYTAPPVVIYRDTAYRAEITQINSASSPTAGIAAMFIDYNRDGLYDTVTERVMNKVITSPTGMDSNTFVVPHNAEIGLTGLRVVLRDNGQSEPCTNYGSGETEDYLAEIRYEPCSGPVASGIVEGDTSMCTGYDYVVYDTTYEGRKSEINRTWQVSGDNILWFNAPNGNNKDTLMRIFTGQPLYYRLRTDCVPSTDTTYSAPMLVNAKAGYKCYCFSQAIGGKLLDTSDIGAYSLAGYINNDGGAHLMNMKATHKRQDHTDELPILIDIDSMYEIKVFQTMRNNLHGDAKVTIFMDFNNNHQYDVPDERVYTGYTAVGNFTLIDYLNVPKTTILNTPTGMRVILNNDLSPNIPSDEACGTYTSGETEDYIVKFIQPFPASVNQIAGISNLSIYPNPTTNGKFRLEFNGTRNVEKVEITVLDVMGRKLKELSYQNNGNQFGTDIDLGGETKGVYFVEVKAGADKRVERVVLR